MPTYDYKCEKCGNVFEVFQSMTARKLRKCPRCGGKLQRLLGTGAGIIFNGSGFYATDYRSPSYQQAEKKEKESQKPVPSQDDKSDKSGSPSQPSQKKSDDQPPPNSPLPVNTG